MNLAPVVPGPFRPLLTQAVSDGLLRYPDAYFPDHGGFLLAWWESWARHHRIPPVFATTAGSFLALGSALPQDLYGLSAAPVIDARVRELTGQRLKCQLLFSGEYPLMRLTGAPSVVPWSGCPILLVSGVGPKHAPGLVGLLRDYLTDERRDGRPAHLNDEGDPAPGPDCYIPLIRRDGFALSQLLSELAARTAERRCPRGEKPSHFTPFMSS
jgi:hypothetical protein